MESGAIPSAAYEPLLPPAADDVAHVQQDHHSRRWRAFFVVVAWRQEAGWVQRVPASPSTRTRPEGSRGATRCSAPARVPFPAGGELHVHERGGVLRRHACRSQRSGVLRWILPSPLPVQPEGRPVGQRHGVGPRRVAQPGPLAPRPAGHGARPLVRHQGRLVRPHHRAPQQHPRHAIHGLNQRHHRGRARVFHRPGRPQ